MRAEGEFTIYPASLLHPLTQPGNSQELQFHRTQSRGAQGGADPRRSRVWGQREVSVASGEVPTRHPSKLTPFPQASDKPGKGG